MSYYNAICMKCPTKRFIVPGTETDNPRHEGNDGPALDALHTPVPLDFHEQRAQMWMLACALEMIHTHVPDAVYLDLETSDQGRYGFVVRGLRATLDGPDMWPDWGDSKHPLGAIYDDVNDQFSDLNWDGVVREDRYGYVTLNILTNEVVEVTA